MTNKNKGVKKMYTLPLLSKNQWSKNKSEDNKNTHYKICLKHTFFDKFVDAQFCVTPGKDDLEATVQVCKIS